MTDLERYEAWLTVAGIRGGVVVWGERLPRLCFAVAGTVDPEKGPRGTSRRYEVQLDRLGEGGAW